MIKTIESALSALAATIMGGSVKTVETYVGQLEGDINKITGRLPAVFVMFNGDAITRDQYGDESHTLRFTTLVACKDLRGKQTARTKSGGAYDLLDALLAGLVDQDMGLAIESLTALRVDMVFVSSTAVVYAIEWSTGYTNNLGA